MSALRDIIIGEIQAGGPLPFARFMELALYHPVHGYYERDHTQVGRAGDFYTSVSVGDLFGGLLANRFAGWLAEIPGPVQLVEAGAHDGRLAGDILGWLQANRPELCRRLTYVLVEPSAQREQWQQKHLARFGDQVVWQRDFRTLKAAHSGRGVRGIIFSNELLDALRVRRVGGGAGESAWFEWGIKGAGDGFDWVRLPISASARQEVLGDLAGLPPELLAVLPDGFTMETHAAAQGWWREAGQALEQGWLVALDYGATFDELLSPERTRGTLRAYAEHRVSDDLLANPGEQDLTAHVNFTAIQRAGESVGLQTFVFEEQERFLTRITQSVAGQAGGAEWLAKRHRQLQTLVHPAHLGRSFRVLAQGRIS